MSELCAADASTGLGGGNKMCISEVPGLAKHRLTPLPTRVRTRKLSPKSEVDQPFLGST
jgi:hypothetical protein